MNVLEDVKKLIGFDADYNAFDTDLIININTTLSVLKQVGVKVQKYLSLESSDSWEDILGEHSNIEMIKQYIYLSVKIIFDPPLNSAILSSYKEEIKNLEWRINFETEVPSDSVFVPDEEDT